jgi:hypothetical protein
VAMVPIVVMMMMATNFNDHLRLRRIRYCEAEDENQSKQNLFHILIVTRSMVNCRAILTCMRKRSFMPPK